MKKESCEAFYFGGRREKELHKALCFNLISNLC
jgi:hypothetical protein